ncbi:MAG: LysR family transcriptional regulator [Planctomycetia bacterium]|nr:LysR family transcriptional regulator [Planctomycetia bacterium]
MPAKKRHAYKEVRLQQLRSFCETARLGSLTAAAASLGLAQPTIWEQVHALEHVFAAKLVERHAHGCRLTPTGRMLAELASPLVAGIDSLQRNVREALQLQESRLTVAATPRIVYEDLPAAIVEFQRQHPQVVFRLMEQSNEQVIASVESGEADLGLTLEREPTPANPWLSFELGYELDLMLVTPKDHPLAERRRFQPRDLLDFPLVNAPDGLPDAAITAALHKLGVFAQPRRVEAFYTSAIRRYVELGFGIGLIVGLPGHLPATNLHERSLSRHFGRIPVSLVQRRGVLPHGAAHSFAQTVKTVLQRPNEP